MNRYIAGHIAAIFVLLCFSFFFSCTETTLFSLSPFQVRKLSRGRAGKLIEWLLANPRWLLTSILIGNMFVNVLSSTLGESLFRTLLGGKGTALAMFVMTFAILVMGEVTPKTIAIQCNTRFAPLVAPVITAIGRILMPIRLAVIYVSDRMIAPFSRRIAPREHAVTEDEIKTAISIGSREGVLGRRERRMIQGVIDFAERRVTALMRPRAEIVAVEALMRWSDPELGAVSPVEFIAVAEESGYIVELGRWALMQACAQGQLWERNFGFTGRVAVNVSAGAEIPELSARVHTLLGSMLDLPYARDLGALAGMAQNRWSGPLSALPTDVRELVVSRYAETVRAFQAAGLDGVAVALTSIGELPYAPGERSANTAVVSLAALMDRPHTTPAVGRMQVFLSDLGAEPRVSAALQAVGAPVNLVIRTADRQRAYDESASAWGLRLAVGVAALALLIAGLVLVLVAATAWRGRARDYAALRMAGVPEVTLRRASLAEQAVVVLLAIGVGAACGIASLHLFKAVIDARERNALSNHAVEIKHAAYVEIHEARNINREAVATHDRALKLLARE